MKLNNINNQKDLIVKKINIEDNELKSFLFSLGLYEGEQIAIIKKKKYDCIVSIKGAKYALDENICKSIEVEELC